jgi:hypothetical protein
MRRHLIVLILMSACLTRPATGQAPTHRGRVIAPDAAVRIFNLAGTVRVTGWDRDSVDVTAIIPTGAGSFYFGGGSGGLKLGVEQPVEDAVYPGSLIEVRVPARARVWIKTESAEILVSGLTASADLSSVSGRIVVTGNVAQLSAESMDGGIDAQVHSGLVRLKTAGGTIVLRGEVADASLGTVSGAATAQVAGLDRGRMETVGGHLTFEAGLRPGGNYTLESHSGDISIRLPTSFDAALDLTALEGRVVNRLNKSPVQPRNRGRGEGLTLSGGKATADLVARTFKGTITLELQTQP